MTARSNFVSVILNLPRLVRCLHPRLTRSAKTFRSRRRAAALSAPDYHHGLRATGARPHFQRRNLLPTKCLCRREPEQDFRHQADRVRTRCMNAGLMPGSSTKKLIAQTPTSAARMNGNGLAIFERCDDRGFQPNESAIPRTAASNIWTVTPRRPEPTGIAHSPQQQSSRRAPTSRGRLLSLQRTA